MILDFNSIDGIVEKLVKASDEYYNNNNSIISDAEFDELKDRLRDIDPDHPFLLTIGATPIETGDWSKRTHNIPMSSLNKCNTSEEFMSWANKLMFTDENGEVSYIVEDKLDGISIDLEYSHGKLMAAITRGDGITGQNILDNVINMQNVKKRLNIPFSGNIRGEIVITKTDWSKLLKHEPKMVNRRNSAGGIAVRSSGEHAEYLTILFYDIIEDKKPFKFEHDKMFKIKQLGLNTSTYIVCKTIKDVIEVMNKHIESLREKKNFDIDGLVVKVNSIEHQEDMGCSSEGNPRGQIAWKFPNETATTILEDIEWSMGKGGAITPVAIFKPVFVAGGMLARASLGSFGEFKRLKLRKGDTVEISRRNDVIPKLERVLVESNNPIIVAPVNCPNCGNKIEFTDKKSSCKNKDCTARGVGDITTWVKSLDIKGLGPALLEELFDRGYVKTPVDFYTNNFKNNNVMSEKVTAKIIKQLNEKKELPLDIFIDGLNIEGVGGSTTRMLVKEGHNTLDKILALTKSQIAKVDGLGDIKAEMVVNGLKEKLPLIKQLLAVGINIVQPKKAVEGGKLTGKSILFTGTMRQGRKEMSKEAEKKGAIVAERVSKDLSILVVPDLAWNSDKVQKAKKLNIQIITEEEYEQKY